MAQIMLINPSPRPSKRKKAAKQRSKKPMAKRRTAAQKAATRKLVAFNKSRKRGATVKRKIKRRRNPIGALAVNPIRKRRRPRVSKAAATTVGRTLRYRRRNPIKMNAIKGVIMPAAMQAAGGLGLTFGMSYLTSFLPAQLRTGMAKNAVELAVAVAIATFGGKFLGRGMAKELAQGAATITLYNLAKTTLATAVPAVGSRLAGYGDYDWNVEGLGYYTNAIAFDNSGGPAYQDYTNVGELFDQGGMGELFVDNF